MAAELYEYSEVKNQRPMQMVLMRVQTPHVTVNLLKNILPSKYMNVLIWI